MDTYTRVTLVCPNCKSSIPIHMERWDGGKIICPKCSINVSDHEKDKGCAAKQQRINDHPIFKCRRFMQLPQRPTTVTILKRRKRLRSKL